MKDFRCNGNNLAYNVSKLLNIHGCDFGDFMTKYIVVHWTMQSMEVAYVLQFAFKIIL